MNRSVSRTTFGPLNERIFDYLAVSACGSSSITRRQDSGVNTVHDMRLNRQKELSYRMKQRGGLPRPLCASATRL